MGSAAFSKRSRGRNSATSTESTAIARAMRAGRSRGGDGAEVRAAFFPLNLPADSGKTSCFSGG